MKFWGWALLAGCSSTVLRDFQAAKSAALAAPAPAPTHWKPDVVVQIAAPTVAEALSPVVEEQLSKKTKLKYDVLGMPATANAALKVKELDLSASPRCEQCLAIDTTLKGKVEWSFAGEEGSLPASIQIGFDAQFTATQEGGVWSLEIAPKDVRKAKVEVGGSKVAAPLEGELATWVRDRLSDIEPFSLGNLGGADLPLRAARVQAEGKDVQIHLLTASPTPGEVAPPKVTLKEGYRVWFSDASLVGLAKAKAFAQGPVGYDVVPEPTSIELQEESFSLGLRLWRPVGAGWWRDYTVKGALDPENKGIKLHPTEVIEGPKSKGAVLADPLAAIGEGYILKTLEQALSTTLPAKQGTKVGDIRLAAKFEHFQTANGVIQIDGSLVVKSTKDR